MSEMTSVKDRVVAVPEIERVAYAFDIVKEIGSVKRHFRLGLSDWLAQPENRVLVTESSGRQSPRFPVTRGA